MEKYFYNCDNVDKDLFINNNRDLINKHIVNVENKY